MKNENSMTQQNLYNCKITKVDKKNTSSFLCLQKIANKLSSKGAILIEFAFSLPVLIVLLYYIYDLNRLKRYYSRTEFVGQQVASMIQNISQSRESKTITLKDLQYIARTAFLSIYPGMSMYKQNGYFEFGHTPTLQIIYVKGLDNGNASCIWRYYYRMSSIIGGAQESSADFEFLRPVYFKTNVLPSQIYSSLTINPGEVKIIVISQITRGSSLTNSLNGKYLTDKQSFDFYLLSPKYIATYNSIYYFFPSVVIFTPRPGLFSETGIGN